MATGQLGWAVTDGPDGTEAIAAPEDATELQRRVRLGEVTLHCSTSAGGCGSPLHVAAGTILRHHFRHDRGSACGLSEDDARDSYTHLRMQKELARWLSDQGLSARLEHQADAQSRFDVFIDGLNHSLEVQLSPQSQADWQIRDERYRQGERSVTWLNGVENVRVIAYQLVHQGFAILIRLLDNLHVELGVRDEFKLVWEPLAGWSMTSEGPSCPHLDEVRRRHSMKRRPRRDETAPEPAPVAASNPSLPPYIPPPADSPRFPHSFEEYPGYSGWYAEQDWAWLVGLPAHLRASAVKGTYYTQVLVIRGTSDLLGLVTGDDTHGVFEALERQGLIESDSVLMADRRDRPPSHVDVRLWWRAGS